MSPRAALAEHALAIVPLEARLSTPEVYAEADRLGLPRRGGELTALRERVRAAVSLGAGFPADLLVNDLAPAACSLCPLIAPALDAVWAADADQALVCGSGPTVAGLYWGADGSERAAAAAETLGTPYPRVTVAVPVSSPGCGTIWRDS